MNGELCLPLFCAVATSRALAGSADLLLTGRPCMEVTRLAHSGADKCPLLREYVFTYYSILLLVPLRVFQCESSLRLSSIMMVSMILCSEHLILSVPCVAGFLVLGQLCRRF